MRLTRSHVAELPDTRQMILSKSRYLLFYRVLEDEDTIEVLALWHQSRGTESG